MAHECCLHLENLRRSGGSIRGEKAALRSCDHDQKISPILNPNRKTNTYALLFFQQNTGLPLKTSANDEHQSEQSVLQIGELVTSVCITRPSIRKVTCSRATQMSRTGTYILVNSDVTYWEGPTKTYYQLLADVSHLHSGLHRSILG